MIRMHHPDVRPFNWLFSKDDVRPFNWLFSKLLFLRKILPIYAAFNKHWPLLVAALK